MVTALVIEQATTADIPGLTALINAAYRGQDGVTGWTSEGAYLEGPRTDGASLQALLEKPGAVFLKAGTSTGIAGCVYLETEEQDMYLGLLSVAPRRQAGGIGRQLLEHAEALARQQGCRAIRITVVNIRSELIAWYERRGFYLTGRSFPFPEALGRAKQPLHFIEMKKDL